MHQVRHKINAFVVLTTLMGIVTGCGDKCEQLCATTRDQIERCKTTTLSSLTWNDLGAKGPQNFVNECRDQWDRERLSLSAPELRRALSACDDARSQLELRRGDDFCEELLALYGDAP